MTHDELALSLAGHLRGPDRMVWCDMQLGPAGSPRPDVYAINKSFVRPTPLAYECKVSVSDFRADVTTGKWQTYLRYASGVYFACEAGLVGKADVPEHSGLIVCKDGAWRIAKKATLRPVEIPPDAFMKLLIHGVEREGPRFRVRPWTTEAALRKLKQEFGEIVAQTIRDRQSIEDEIGLRQMQAERIVEEARRRAEQIRKQAAESVEPLRTELAGIVGLPATADGWELTCAVNRLKQAQKEHPAHEELRQLTTAIQRALSMFGAKEAKEAA